LAQVSKVSFVYVLDRATGRPVWPIVERPVPAGNVPGEWYSPTQPYPTTRPPGYDHQELTTDSLIDFTPELRQEAMKIVAPYRMGSLFMPPTVAEPNGTKGSIVIGSAATTYNGAGFDPDTGTLFVTSVHAPKGFEMVRAPEPNPQNLWVMNGTANGGPGIFLPGPQGRVTFTPSTRRIYTAPVRMTRPLLDRRNGVRCRKAHGFSSALMVGDRASAQIAANVVECEVEPEVRLALEIKPRAANRHIRQR
jgi:hypothetical protein